MSVDRGFTWMDDETLSLIDIFSTDEIQKELNGSKRNIGIYERIASELSEFGFKRTAYQCREKIKRLRKEYHHAKYCIENDITPKKPMKYFELVDKLFNQDASVQISNDIDLSSVNSDHEEEIHFTFNFDRESSNSCNTKESLPQNSFHFHSASPLHEKSNNTPVTFEDNTHDSFSNSQHNSEDTLLNGVTNYDLSDKDETESLWVPNVVLVENDGENVGIRNEPEAQIDSNDDETLQDFDVSPNEPFLKDSEEPPHKRRRKDSDQEWFKEMLDNVTETFLAYQESAESRFLEKIAHLEKERMKRDENMQRLWLEFEERKRKDEQQHELKMLSLLGKFVNQISGNEVKDSA